MTTWAPTFTSRWRGTYKVGGIQHTLQLRGPRGATFATMDGYKDRARELFTAVNTFLFDDFEWISAEVCLTDTEEFLPATLPGAPAGGLIDGSVLAPRARIRGATFSGKAPGSRARFTLFGISLADYAAGSAGGDGVLTPAELPGLSTIISTAGTYFYANSGGLASWHNRATYKENDHLLKLVRRGTIS